MVTTDKGRMKNLVTRGQHWKQKAGKRIIVIGKRKSGNRHWMTDSGHEIHEGTLLKFYERVKP